MLGKDSTVTFTIEDCSDQNGAEHRSVSVSVAASKVEYTLCLSLEKLQRYNTPPVLSNP